MTILWHNMNLYICISPILDEMVTIDGIPVDPTHNYIISMDYVFLTDKMDDG